MPLSEIGNLISNVGIPAAILYYLIWRLDKFLTALTGRLEIFNHELGDIGYALNGIIEELRRLNPTEGKKVEQHRG